MILEETTNTPKAWSRRAERELDSASACGWSPEGQAARHCAVVEALDPQPGDRLLDWGCGTGALVEHVSADLLYVGYDSAEGMVERARREHHGFVFKSSPPIGCFDLIACVGCFNLPDRWSKQHTWHALRTLWDQYEPRMLAVSVYAGTDERCLIYAGAELARAGAQLAYHVRIDQIRANDLLLTVRR